MKTRFDVTDVWVRTYTSPVKISDMSTPHILNAVKMFIQNPVRTLSMLITDIESTAFSETIWTAHNNCDKMQSLKNVTSMSCEELIEYAMNSPLFKSLIAELDSRGVNTENVIRLFTTAEAPQVHPTEKPAQDETFFGCC